MAQLLRSIGKSGIMTSAVGIGTWAMGGWLWGGGANDEDSLAAIHESLDMGITLIDTAPVYGLGRAEEIVGRAIKGRRNEVTLVTKCGLVWDTEMGRPVINQADKVIHSYLGGASIRRELEASLRRLGTNWVDVYITHKQDPTTPISETLDELSKLKAEGKIRAIGISNVSDEELLQYISSGDIDCVQECYNMIDRNIEKTIIPICIDNEISVISYSSLAFGLLTGEIGRDRVFGEGDFRYNHPLFTPEIIELVSSFKEAIRPVTDRYNVSMANCVTAWTLAQQGIGFALCGARNAMQARENSHAGNLILSNKDIAEINAAFDARRGIS